MTTDAHKSGHSLLRLKRTRAAIALGVALLMMFAIRSTVASVYSVPIGSLEPELPAGSRVLVYKLADSFSPGQIIAFNHDSGQVYLGRVEDVDTIARTVTVSRNGVPMEIVQRDTIIGRVVMNTR